MKLFVTAFSLLFVLSVLPTYSTEVSQTLVKLPDGEITVSEYEQRLAMIPAQTVRTPEDKRRILEDMITERLILKESQGSNIEEDPIFQQRLESFRNSLKVQRFIEKILDENTSVEGSDVRDFYETRKDQFNIPEMVRASHILVRDEAHANELLKQLEKGVDFATLARENSVDGTASNGGDLGFFPKGRMIPEFEEAAFSLKPGEISGVIKTQAGYHIIKLMEKNEGRPLEFSEVKDQIRQSLLNQKKQQYFTQWTNDLRTKSGAAINEILLQEVIQEEQPPAGS